MIKVLQKKFVSIAMFAISILILFLLGTINIGNYVLTNKKIDDKLLMLTRDQKEFSPSPHNDTMPPNFPGFPVKNDYDTFMSSSFFEVRFDERNEIIGVDVSRTSTISEDSAKEMSVALINEQKHTGFYSKFKYLIHEHPFKNEKSILFLDISDELLSYIRILLLSSILGLFCWTIMLFVILHFSKKAILPIAQSFERQKQFITDAGHEIKTPLAIIQSNTEAMELFHGENKWSQNIKIQIARLDELMKKLLLLAKMDETSALQIKKEFFNLDEVLLNTLKHFNQQIENKSLILLKDIQSDIKISADKSQVEQLISILVDNAVKYSNQNGTISIQLFHEHQRLSLIIKNTCKELPLANPEKLFDRFYRDDSSRTQNKGYGLGLSIAQSIVHGNNGSIHAEYQQPNIVIITVLL